jgi:hypothetical protein
MDNLNTTLKQKNVFEITQTTEHIECWVKKSQVVVSQENP